MPRLGVLLLLSAACTAPEDRAVQALTDALVANRAGFAAIDGLAVGAATGGAGRLTDGLGGGAPGRPNAAIAGAPATTPGVVAPTAPRRGGPAWPTQGPVAATPATAPGTPRRRDGPAPLATTQLLGAGPDMVRRWLGEPSLRRAEGTAEVWLYLAPGCALDLVLYRDRGGLAVTHAAARARDAANRAVTEAACLAAIAGDTTPAAAGLDTGRGG